MTPTGVAGMAVRIADKKPGGVLVGKKASVEAVAALLAAHQHADDEGDHEDRHSDQPCDQVVSR